MKKQNVIKAFLFDFSGTLIRSPKWMALEVRDLPRAALGSLARSGHIPLLSDEQLGKAEAVFQTSRQTANRTNRETSHVADLIAMLDALGYQQRVPHSLVEETVAALHRNCIPTVELMAHSEKILARLQALGLRLGIVSNAAYAPFLTWTLDHFNILGFFEEVVVSADVGRRKPGLEIFQVALRRMGLKPGETVYVGDDFHKDVVASKQLGLRAVWYRPDGDSSIPDGEPIPDAVVAGHDEVPALAEQWLLISG